MKQDIYIYIGECDICQRYKHDNVAPLNLLQPLSIPEKVWQDTSISVIEDLPKVVEKEVIFVVVDRLHKVAHFMHLKTPLYFFKYGSNFYGH